MKFNTMQFVLSILALLIVNSCKEGYTFPDVVRAPSKEHGQVRFYNFVINGPQVEFYANGVKSTSRVSTTGQQASTGLGYGATHPNIGYVEIPAGENILIEAITPPTYLIPANNVNNYGQNLLAASLIVPKIEALKTYSIYLCGYWDKVAQKGNAFIIDEVMPGVDTASTFIRFVNSGTEQAGPLRFAVTNTRDTLVGTIGIAEEVPFAKGSPFVAVPYGTYDLKLYTATGDSLIRRGIALSPDRVHTFALRGDILAKTPAPWIDNIQNR